MYNILVNAWLREYGTNKDLTNNRMNLSLKQKNSDRLARKKSEKDNDGTHACPNIRPIHHSLSSLISLFTFAVNLYSNSRTCSNI